MLSFNQAYRKNTNQQSSKDSEFVISEEMRAITYSMDALIPGLYLWLGPLTFRLGGSEAEENYPGMIHSFAGCALVFPEYRIYSTYQGDYDPR